MNKIVSLSDLATPSIGHLETVRLGMAHLSPGGLSEQWLLRHCGDIHWSLIARAIGQDRAVFRDDCGKEAYAAFCATSLELSPTDKSLLGDDVVLSSDICRVGSNRIGSVHRLHSNGGALARIRMISTFVSHDETGLNRRITRNRSVDRAILPSSRPELTELADAARATARRMSGRTSCAAPHFQATPCPTLDFNAVGLLYFPAFSRLAELAQWTANGYLAPLARRDVVYLGNVDAGIGVDLVTDGDDICICRAGGESIAHVHTRRYGAKDGRDRC